MSYSCMRSLPIWRHIYIAIRCNGEMEFCWKLSLLHLIFVRPDAVYSFFYFNCNRDNRECIGRTAHYFESRVLYINIYICCVSLNECVSAGMKCTWRGNCELIQTRFLLFVPRLIPIKAAYVLCVASLVHMWALIYLDYATLHSIIKIIGGEWKICQFKRGNKIDTNSWPIYENSSKWMIRVTDFQSFVHETS